MRRFNLFSLAAVLVLAGCHNEKRPNSYNFTKAINQHLARHGQECIFFAQTFPIDVPVSELKAEAGTAPQMAALERAGLVRGSDMTAAIRGMMGALGPSAPHPVRHYELTNEGRKYLQVKPGVLGQSSAFCYGEEQVASIVKWDEPTTQDGTSVTQVTYTYKFQQLADWAKRPDIQQAFPAIKSTMDQVGTNQVIELHLTNAGWEARIIRESGWPSLSHNLSCLRVRRQIKDSIHATLHILTLDMDDSMNGRAYLRVGFSRKQGRSAAHEQGAQPKQRAFGAAGVNGGQCSPMSTIHRVEQSAGLGAAYLTENDPVRVMTKVRAQQIVKDDRFPMRIGLRLFRDHMRFADVQLGSILDNKDAFFFRDRIGQDIEQGRFAGPCSTRDKQCYRPGARHWRELPPVPPSASSAQSDPSS